ncbi:dipeptidase [Sporosalibacterium faouarense]|uniref:dipeptidase n=1 Tax=Sporosalibacterium faouarense TaxID=516123 RepID=UPI00141C7550|nr:dipeptidase [Sporosalibacterium faouarense]MTI48062.1 membrane dipeptidase [Bacillota bacterium]
MSNFIVDAHCDTLLGLEKSHITRTKEEKDFYKNDSTAITLEKMKKAKVDLQFMAIWLYPIYNPELSLKKCLNYIDLLYRKLEENSDHISIIHNYEELVRNKEDGKMSALLALEGGEPIGNDLAVLRVLYKLGLRCMTLTWNGRNSIADGVGENISGGGLTHFGREVVKEMNRLGIIVDVSHLSEKSFWDVMDITDKPLIASHSCAYNICQNDRNLKDNQIKAVSKLNGVIGVNYFTKFLENEPEKANVNSIVNHIEYIANLGGIDCVGLGSDYDGAKVPEDVSDISQIYKISDEMRKRGFKEEDINKVMGNNFARVIKDILR